MKAIRLNGPGDADVLDYADHDLADPEPGQIRIRHTAIGVNFIDIYHRSGLYPLTFPSGLGLEAAGVVEACGPGVDRFREGDRVGYCTGPSGAYAEAGLVPADRAVALPDGVSDETAAACMLKGMTAHFLLRRVYAVRSGDTILFHAAAGGVGSIACAWANHLGATVIGTVGSDEKAERAGSHGCHHPIVYTREDFVARTRDLTDGAGVQAVYDSVGKATFDGSLDCLARRGILVSFGNASGPPPALDILKLSQKGSLYVTRPTLFDYVATTEELDTAARELFEVVQSGVVPVDIRQRFALADAAEAHRALESRKTTGSTILLP